MPSALPNAPALTSHSALLLYSLESWFSPFPNVVVTVTITVKSKCAVGEKHREPNSNTMAHMFKIETVVFKFVPRKDFVKNFPTKCSKIPYT